MLTRVQPCGVTLVMDWASFSLDRCRQGNPGVLEVLQGLGESWALRSCQLRCGGVQRLLGCHTRRQGCMRARPILIVQSTRACQQPLLKPWPLLQQGLVVMQRSRLQQLLEQLVQGCLACSVVQG